MSRLSGRSKSFFTRYRRDEEGVAAVEFALTLPLLTLVMIGILEFGFYIYESSMVMKSLRAGAMYAARFDDVDVLDGATTEVTQVKNLIKYGTVNPAADANTVISGWARGDEVITITVTEVSEQETDSVDYDVSYYRIRIDAEVRYEPFVSGFMSRFGELWIRSYHTQVSIGLT